MPRRTLGSDVFDRHDLTAGTVRPDRHAADREADTRAQMLSLATPVDTDPPDLYGHYGYG